MTKLDIIISGDDHRTLDGVVRRVIAAVPTTEVGDVVVRVHSRTAGRQARQITLVDPSEKIAGLLAHIDVPQNVHVSLREPR